MTAELIMLLGSLSCFFITLYWVRKRILKDKYAMYWLALSLIILSMGFFPQLIMSVAHACRLSYPTVLLTVNFIIFYTAGFLTSVSLSKQSKRNIVLTQEIALLEQRMSALEAKNSTVKLENK